ncbi:MAG TPA: general secretion pathway protein GspE [Kosmotogaceae bacterium]|nr:MAG: Type II secretion system protein E [Thermotogales bacterium 46_20]HAA84799.1 general secretion pathway protein GspE [Kosmotogaceae bacterium]
MKVYKRLGELLEERGLINSEALNQAVSIQKKVGKPLGEVLVSMGLMTWEDIYNALSKQYNLELLEDTPSMISSELLRMVPKSVASRLGVVPIEYIPESDTLRVVTTDVLKVPQIERELTFLTGHTIVTLLTTPPVLQTVYKTFYEDTTSSEIIEHTFQVDDSDIEKHDAEAAEGEDTPVGKFINSLIDTAIRSEASDIHLEPYEKIAVGRIRVDGILRPVLKYPRKAHNSVASRIKVISGLDISERRLPQDGKFYMRRSSEQFDFRVSTMPTVYGEKVVMRILKVSNSKLKLEALGLSKYNRERFEGLINSPYGIVLLSGPTGSGKSTTLVAVLNEITSEKVNVLTAEDPVEYTIEGVTQCQINPEIGLTFANYLRSFLRQDPDIIMVGEIRDRETAQLAIEASLTGHLVLSTIHTNTAAGAVARLVNMGTDPHLLATSLDGVVGQRLVRKLCSNCKARIPIREKWLQVARKLFPDREEFFEHIPGQGCHECAGTGYKGRTGIHEVLIMNNKIRELIRSQSSEQEVLTAARNTGMRTLFEDGVFKVIEGTTSFEEINRVVIDT